MIAWEPFVHRFFRYLTSTGFSSSSAMFNDLPPVQVHNLEAATEKRLRTLKHLIKANHINYATFSKDFNSKNNLPQLLCSAYVLGADVQKLHEIYDKESIRLDAWSASPAEITHKEWRDYLGDKTYLRAYVDFFEDELALRFDYDWKSLVQEYLFSGEEPLIHGTISGLSHSLIRMSYAFEFSSRELAIEALAEACVSYDCLHKYLDNLSFTTPSSSFVSTSLHEILNKIHNDKRLDNIFDACGSENIKTLFSQYEDYFLEYWNSWIIENPIKQFQDSQDIAIALLIQTVKPGTHAYDISVAHILTTSHAIRILLPLIPEQYQIGLIRQWWLITIAIYISQLRPEISHDKIELSSGKDWKYVEHKAICGSWATDADYVKIISAMREAASTWGDNRQQYLAAAVRLTDDFDGWTRFG